jgi:hypothetical protein
VKLQSSKPRTRMTEKTKCKLSKLHFNPSVVHSSLCACTCFYVCDFVSLDSVGCQF